MGKPSPALVISIVALVFAMTGTGIAAKSLITGKQIKDGSITAKDIANGAITQKKLGRGAVASSNLAPGAVGGAAIGAGAITSAMLAPNAVTSAKIAPNAVLSGNLAAGAITADALAPNAVTASALADNSVGPRNLLTSGSSTRSRRGSRSASPTFQICPNGVVVLQGAACPVARGWVEGDMTKVASFPVDLDGVSSQCTRTRTDMPFAIFGGPNSTDPGFLAPVLDGTWVAAAGYAADVTQTSFDVQADWGNVSEAATNFMGIEFFTGERVSGSTDPVNVRSLGYNKTFAIGPGATAAGQNIGAQLQKKSTQVFTAYAIACNTTASGAGAPTLTNFDIYAYYG